MLRVQGALDMPAAAKEAEEGKSASDSAAEPAANGRDGDKSGKKGAPAEKHHALLLRLLADELGAVTCARSPAIVTCDAARLRYAR
jgi:hypothetical protein